MLAYLIDQMRTGGLIEVHEPPAKQTELRALQLRQIESEGNLSYWNHGLTHVAIGRNHIDRSSAGERRDVEIGKLTVEPHPRGVLTPLVSQ